MNDVVVVLRLKNGDDILAVIDRERDGKVVVEHPHFVKFNTATGTVTMLPYCALSDETLYEFDRQELTFVVTATDDISHKFLAMVNEVDQIKHTKAHAQSDESVMDSDQLDASYIQGNQTKH